MGIYKEYWDSVELDDGRELRIEYSQYTVPATFHDPAEVETSDYKVYLDGERVLDSQLGELAHIAQELFENGDPIEWDPIR